MRIFERITYVLAVGLAIAYGMEEFLASFILACLIIINTYVGALVEGLRFVQWIYLVAFIPHIILIVMDVYSIIALVVYCSFLLFTLILVLIFGEGNLDAFENSGPYEVGHKDLFTTEDGIEVSCYYPMDREEYQQTLKQDSKRNSLMFRHGYSSRLGLAKATAPYGTDNYRNPWFFKYLDDVRMNTCQDGKLAAVYSSGDKKLIPVVFLHGLCGTRTTYSQSCRDFASHGFIVFTLSHFDGTANYSKKRDGEEKYWTSNVPHMDIEYRRDQLKIRKEEVRQLIDDICTDNYLQE